MNVIIRDEQANVFVDPTLYLNELVTRGRWRQCTERMEHLTRKWIEHVPRPKTSPRGLVSAEEVAEYLQECRVVFEERLIGLAQTFSSAQWLWYLRRLPEDFFFARAIPVNRYDSLLAEYLTGQSIADIEGSTEYPFWNFPITPSIVSEVLNFCCGVRLYAEIHTGLRWAGKGVSFRIKARGRPHPVPSSQMRRAVSLFDERRARSHLLGFDYGSMGTILGTNDYEHSNIWGAVPSPQRVIKEENFWALVNKLDDPVVFPSRYLPLPTPLKRLGRLTSAAVSHPDFSITREIAALFVLLWHTWPIASNLFFWRLNFSYYGYFPMHMDQLLEGIRGSYQHVIDDLKSVLPKVDFPTDADELLKLLSNCTGQTWPFYPGPVLRAQGEHVLVDMVAATEQLHRRLEFPFAQGELPNIRGHIFEDEVQELIDGTQWQPSDETRLLRGKTLRFDSGGKLRDLTDFDAVGQKDNTLLIVSCKSEVIRQSYESGDYQSIRNTATRLLSATMHWQAVKVELMNNLIGRNYDLSQFTEVIAVVCTPQICFTSDAVCLREVTQGLRAVVGVRELWDWLS